MFKFIKKSLFRNHLFCVNLISNVAMSKSSITKKYPMENTIFREWVYNPSYGNYQKKNGETEITVMSYNILAQDLIDKHPHLYYRHNQNDLTYERRSNIIFNEIKRLKPDILCLQEMQENHLDDFKKKCNEFNLQAVIFKKRTGVDQTDGCAIFFNTNLLELVQHEKVEYYQPNVQFLNRNNVAIIAKFRLKCSPNSDLVVATTHLLYTPRRQDVRLAQLQVLLAEIERISFCCHNVLGQLEYYPIILTGDFNFNPSSAHYALVVNGFLKFNNLSKGLAFKNTFYEPEFGNRLLPIELGIADNCQHYKSVKYNDRSTTLLNNSEYKENGKTITTEEIMKSNVPFETGTISHSFNFNSVYSSNLSVSTFQNQWLLVDYIFYRRDFNQKTRRFEENKLKLLARFELPGFEHCSQYLPYGRIPNMWQGSDHFSLAAKFLLSPTSPI